MYKLPVGSVWRHKHHKEMFAMIIGFRKGYPRAKWLTPTFVSNPFYDNKGFEFLEKYWHPATTFKSKLKELL